MKTVPVFTVDSIVESLATEFTNAVTLASNAAERRLHEDETAAYGAQQSVARVAASLGLLDEVTVAIRRLAHLSDEFVLTDEEW